VPSAESAAVEQAIEVVAQATTTMRAAMAAASAAEQRIKTLERSVEQARNEARSQRELVMRLQAEAAALENASHWLWPLLLALLGAALLAAALAWRLWKRPTGPAPAPEWRDARIIAKLERWTTRLTLLPECGTLTCCTDTHRSELMDANLPTERARSLI
jgi:hypothetical protein